MPYPYRHFPSPREIARAKLSELLRQSAAAYNAMTPEQQAAMHEAQRQSWLRGMAPCEHGVRDWEGCPECIAKWRAPMTKPSEWAKERAELAVDNAECAAQLEVKDQELRDSFIRNIAAALDEARDSILDRLKNPDEAMVEAVASALWKYLSPVVGSEVALTALRAIADHLAKLGGSDAKVP